MVYEKMHKSSQHYFDSSANAEEDQSNLIAAWAVREDLAICMPGSTLQITNQSPSVICERCVYIYTYFVIIINHKQVWSLGLFRYGNQPSTIFIGFALAQRAKVPNLCGRPANNPRGRLNRRQRKGGVMIVEVHLVLARRLRRTTSWKFLPLWNWESRDKSKVKDDVLSTLSVQCPGYWIFW